MNVRPIRSLLASFLLFLIPLCLSADPIQQQIYERIEGMCKTTYSQFPIQYIKVTGGENGVYDVVIDAGAVKIKLKIEEVPLTQILTIKNPQVEDVAGKVVEHIKTHQIQFDTSVDILVGNIFIPLPKNEALELADVDVFNDMFKSHPPTDDVMSFKFRPRIVANDVAKALYPYYKLRLASLGLPIKTEVEFVNELSGKLQNRELSTHDNEALRKLFTSLLYLDVKIRILEEALRDFENFSKPEEGNILNWDSFDSEKLLTKKGARRITDIRVLADSIFESIATEELPSIFEVHGTWLTEGEASEEKIELKQWMLHDLIAPLADRLLELLDRTQKAPTIEFKVLVFSDGDKAKPTSLWKLNPEALGMLDWKNKISKNAFRTFLSAFTSHNWQEPKVRPALNWVREKINAQFRRVVGDRQAPLIDQALSSERATDILHLSEQREARSPNEEKVRRLDRRWKRFRGFKR